MLGCNPSSGTRCGDSIDDESAAAAQCAEGYECCVTCGWCSFEPDYGEPSVYSCVDRNDREHCGGCGIACTYSQYCDDGVCVGPESTCGDGVVDEGFHCIGDPYCTPAEECDDGNTRNDDDCLSTCTRAYCGDGYLRPEYEQCDDGNYNDDDGCRIDCTLP
jgi:cysteine-rich repeat protein